MVALETAEENITCNAICPGFVGTPLVEGQIDAQAVVVLVCCCCSLYVAREGMSGWAGIRRVRRRLGRLSAKGAGSGVLEAT